MGQRLSPNALRHCGPIAGIAAHGNWVATAGYDNRIVLWERVGRRALARGAHDHLANQCAFSPDGRWLVSASSDYSARVWALPSMQLQVVLGGHEDDVDMAQFSPDSARIATCALDRRVRIFDLRGICLHDMPGHTGNVLSLVWSPDGRHVLSSSVDGSIRRWDAELGIEVERTELAVRSDSVEIGQDGTVYAGDDFGRIAIIQNGRPSFVQAHRAGVKKIAFDAARGVLVSLSYDRSMAIWQVGRVGQVGQANAPALLTEVGRTTLPECVWARAATVLPDGCIATGTFGSSYAVYDPRTNAWDLEGIEVGPAINAVLGSDAQVHAVGDAGTVWTDGAPVAEMGSLCNFLAESGAHLFAGGQLGRVFDARTGKVLYEHHAPLICATGFQVGDREGLAVGTYTGEILLFGVGANGALTLDKTLAVYDNAVKGLSCSDGLLFSVCASTDIAWHRVSDGTQVRRIDHAHERIANACCVIGPGRFASVGRDRTLRLWDGEHSESFSSPHSNSVKCIAVNGARTEVLTGCYGGTLARFDLRRKRWTEVQRPTTAGVSSIAWDRLRQRFVAASFDGQIYPVAA